MCIYIYIYFLIVFWDMQYSSKFCNHHDNENIEEFHNARKFPCVISVVKLAFHPKPVVNQWLCSQSL